MSDVQRSVTLVGLLQAAALLTIVFSFFTGLNIPHPYIELFCHFRMQYLVVSVLLLIFFIATKRMKCSVAIGLAAAFNFWFVAGWYFSDVPATQGVQLKIVHANVHSSNDEYQRFVNFVAEEAPDIVFMQEVTDAWVDGTASLRRDYPYFYLEPRAGNFGIAMFSRVPLRDVRHVDSAPFDYPTIVAQLTLDDRNFSIISTHPTIPVNKYLYAARNEQLQSVADLVNEQLGGVILVGDLNASIWDIRYKQLEQSTGLRNVRRGFGIRPTWPTFMPFAMIPIDHALVSKDIGVDDVSVGRRIGSDHLPLVITLRL